MNKIYMDEASPKASIPVSKDTSKQRRAVDKEDHYSYVFSSSGSECESED